MPNNLIILQARQFSLKRGIKSLYASFTKPLGNPKPPYSHVIQIGDPTLRQNAEEVSKELIQSPEIKYIIKRMKHVCKKYNCIGLAAPQVGVPLRIIIAEFNETHSKLHSEKEFIHKEMQYMPQTTIINPEIKVIDYEKIVYSEGCLSVLGFLGDVPRYRTIQVSGYNENEEKITFIAKGWCARIIQHEVDHLNGILYTDMMEGKSFCCSGWHEINENRGRVELRYDGE